MDSLTNFPTNAFMPVEVICGLLNFLDQNITNEIGMFSKIPTVVPFSNMNSLVKFKEHI